MIARQVPFCEPCAMGHSCPDHDPRPSTGAGVVRCPCCGAEVTGEPYDIGSGPERSCPHCEMCWGVNGQALQPLDAEAILRALGLLW